MYLDKISAFFVYVSWFAACCCTFYKFWRLYHIFLTIFIVEKEGVKLFTNEGGA
jgi:hypothetical protein